MAMKGLQDLPAELLICVCEALGGRELRRGKGAAGRITVCRSWYDAALPIYLSGLDVTAVRLYGYNIQTLTEGPSSYATQRRLMHKNTRDLQIRLISHCWDESHARELEAQDDDHHTSNFDALSAARTEVPCGNTTNAAYDWQHDVLRPALEDTCTDISNFTVLEHLTVASLCDSDLTLPGIEENAITAHMLHILIVSLPVLRDLCHLTLDIAGLDLGSDTGTRHICDDLARVLPTISNVRLRLPRICADIFDLPASLTPSSIQCKSLVIKLHQPQHGLNGSYRTSVCGHDSGSGEASTYYGTMIDAAREWLCQLSDLRDIQVSTRGKKHAKTGGNHTSSHGVDLLRMTHVSISGPCLVTVDCLTMKVLSTPEEFFVYEDDGTPCWYEDERTDLVECGSFSV